MTWKEKDYGKIAEGKTGTELLEQIKAQHKECGKNYYKAAWDRKDWWPEG